MMDKFAYDMNLERMILDLHPEFLSLDNSGRELTLKQDYFTFKREWDTNKKQASVNEENKYRRTFERLRSRLLALRQPGQRKKQEEPKEQAAGAGSMVMPSSWDGSPNTLSAHLAEMSGILQDYADLYDTKWKNPTGAVMNEWALSLRRFSERLRNKKLKSASDLGDSGAVPGQKDQKQSTEKKQGIWSKIVSSVGPVVAGALTALGGWIWDILMTVPLEQIPVYSKALVEGAKVGLDEFVNNNSNGVVFLSYNTAWAATTAEVIHIGTYSKTLGTGAVNQLPNVLNKISEQVKNNGLELVLTPPIGNKMENTYRWELKKSAAVPQQAEQQQPAQNPQQPGEQQQNTQQDITASISNDEAIHLIKIANSMEDAGFFDEAEDLDNFIAKYAAIPISYLYKSEAGQWRASLNNWNNYLRSMAEKTSLIAQANPDVPDLKRLANSFAKWSNIFARGMQDKMNKINFFFGKPKGVSNLWRRKVLDQRYIRTK